MIARKNRCFLLKTTKKGDKKRKKILFSDFAAVNDSTSVLFVAKMLFIITSVIIVPLYGYVAILSIKFGFSQQNREWQPCL